MNQQRAGLAAPRRPRAGLLGNSSALLGGRMTVAALGWAGTILIARKLGTEEFGQFAFVFSLMGLMSFATDLSSSRILVGALVEPGADRGALAGTYICLRALLGSIAYGAAVVFVALAGYPSQVVLATAAAGLSLVLGSASGALDSVFQAEVRMGHVALGDVLGQLTQLGLTVAVALTRPSLLLFVLPALSFDLVALLWKSLVVRSIVVPRLSLRPRFWWSVLRQAAPLALGSALFGLSVEVPVVLLSKLDSFTAVAAYAIAIKFVTLATFLPQALAGPLLPLLVRSWPKDPEVFRSTVRRALLLLTFAGGGFTAAFVPVVADLVTVLYGEDYRNSALAAAVTVVGACVTFGTHVALVVLVTVNRARTFIALGGLKLAVASALTLLLVPSLSFEGAAVAVLGSQLVVMLSIAVLALREPALHPLPVGRMSVTWACSAAAVGVGLGARLVMPWPLAGAAAVLTYLALVELTRAPGPRGIRSLLAEETP